MYLLCSFILLFSVAGSHAFLITVQQEVDSLQSRITEEMGNSQELRIEVAEGRSRSQPPPRRPTPRRPVITRYAAHIIYYILSTMYHTPYGM